MVDVDHLPGADLIRAGVGDLAAGIESVPALLVAVGAPRLRQLGYAVPDSGPTPEHRLYTLLAQDDPDSAHGRYNALVRRLVSYERAPAFQAATADRIREFMRAIGREAAQPGRVFFTGGATAVLSDWRETTIDVDIKLVPDQDSVFRAIPVLNETLQLNVELASPDDFIPVRPDWPDRSPFIVREGRLDFHHFDLVAQALAKIERGHVQDLADVREMLTRGLVTTAELREYFDAISARLYRYPAIDPASFEKAVAAITAAD